MAKRATDWQTELEQLWKHLEQPGLLYVPIRHHSPACAWHLGQLIRERRPASILIEGPPALRAHLDVLTHPELRPPIALFLHFVDRDRVTLPPEARAEAKGNPPRFGAYFPLCNYSPELVAIREGDAVGARIGFCDLEHPEQVVAETSGGREWQPSLFDERWLSQSRYLQALAARSGCRDTDELWDRKFESAFHGRDSRLFWQEVAAYCYFARLNADPDQLRADGTLARESRMREIIQAEKRRLARRKENGPLLVVTGGFHTPPLALNEREASVTIPEVKWQGDDYLTVPIRYSFPQLDALNGYAAGMPAPGYYQRLWDAAGTAAHPEMLEEVALDLFIDLARQARQVNLNQTLSTADGIAALQQATNLARFRGNPGPMREDLLDGIRSSFVKGSLDAEGLVILRMARELLCGEAVGALPSGVRTHPLIEDFLTRTRELGLTLETATAKTLDLEIHRKERHRQISRLFRMLEFLDTPFARCTGGPDFVRGIDLELQIEHWTYAWTPQTESTLVDLGRHGGTLPEVVIAVLIERQEELAAQGAAGGSLEAVTLLLVACRLGLAAHAERFVPFVEERIRTEGRFASCVAATTQLDQLVRCPSPLETSQLEIAPAIRAAAFERACYLIGLFPRLPEEEIDAALEHLPMLHELLVADHAASTLDRELFWNGCEKAIRPGETVAPELRGGMIGLLWRTGRISRERAMQEVAIQRSSVDGKGSCFTRFLLGLFALCREVTWSDRDFMGEVDAMLRELDEEAFHRSLPELRLAFTRHTPQETDRVARLIAGLHGTDSIGEWYQRDLDEAFMLRCSQAAGRLAALLKQDHLTHYLAHEPAE